MRAKRKTKTNRKKKIIGISIALTLACIAVYFVIKIFFTSSFARYEGFGIDMPVNYSIHGIDVSKYQRNINWDEVIAMKDKNISLKFAFIKATEGLENIDPSFRRNWLNAKRAGMTRGAYHFFLANKSGKEQAENFIQTVEIEHGDLPPVLDVEKTYGQSAEIIQKNVEEWLEIVEEKYGIEPIIYTNANFYETYLSPYFDNYKLWVAHYLNNNKPAIERDWTFWQHSESGNVNGIDSKVDFNVFNGGSIAFYMLKKK